MLRFVYAPASASSCFAIVCAPFAAPLASASGLSSLMVLAKLSGLSPPGMRHELVSVPPSVGPFADDCAATNDKAKTAVVAHFRIVFVEMFMELLCRRAIRISAQFIAK